MICYWHPNEATPPAHLIGARELATRPVQVGHAFGLGPGWMLSKPPSDAVPLAGGWLAWVAGKVDASSLQRETTVYPVLPVLDGENEEWWLPVVINLRGDRAFSVKYGENWLPVLSQEQTALLEMAREARSFIEAKMRQGDEETDVIEPCSAQWVAHAICATNHVTLEVIQKLCLMDNYLITGGLFTLAALDA